MVNTLLDNEKAFLVQALGALALPTDSLNDLRAKFYSGTVAGTLSLDKNTKPRFPGRYYTYDSALAGDATTTPILGSMFLGPFQVGTVTTFDRIGCEVTAGVAGSTVECLVYAYDGNTTFTKLLQQSIDASVVGFNPAVINLSLSPGVYWVGTAVFSPTTAPTLRARGLSMDVGMSVANDNTSSVGGTGIASAAAIGSSFQLATNQTATVPKIMLRRA